MKIYTKTGDDGETGLFGGARVSKTDARVEALGAIDELNAALGVASAHSEIHEVKRILRRVQGELFALGAEVALTPGARPRDGAPVVSDENVNELERDIDGVEAGLPPLKSFILPGGSRAGAELHLARTICRRAERRLLVVSPKNAVGLRYLNRLSDLLFMLARFENHLQETSETPWPGSKES